jgi:hypothetical protein
MDQIVKSVGGVIGSVLGISPKAPTPPALEAPKTMPTMDAAAVAEAKRKSIAAQQARGGRASTFLSDVGTTDKMGA